MHEPQSEHHQIRPCHRVNRAKQFRWHPLTKLVSPTLKMIAKATRIQDSSSLKALPNNHKNMLQRAEYEAMKLYNIIKLIIIANPNPGILPTTGR